MRVARDLVEQCSRTYGKNTGSTAPRLYKRSRIESTCRAKDGRFKDVRKGIEFPNSAHGLEKRVTVEIMDIN